MTSVKNWIKENEQLILDTYQELHNRAEVSWQEFRTKEFLCEQLEKLELPYKTFEHHTGIIVNWQEGDGPTVGLRADMDALWQNVNGEWRANHSCGHDAHMTMALNALRCLKETGFKPNGCFKVIFQPAEESGKGAMALLEQGLIDDIDYLVGIHVRPKLEIRYGEATPAIYHGATTLLKGKITGVQAHGSRPNMGINTVDSLGAIIAAVNAIKVDPSIPSSVKVTQVKAGGQNINVIPDEAEFGIDLRAQTNEAMEELIPKIMKAVISAGSANGAEVDLNIEAKMVAASPNPFMEEIVRGAIIEQLGEEAVKAPPLTPGGEDFHFYDKGCPKIQTTIIGLGTDLEPGLHHPSMTFNLRSLGNGTAVLAAAAFKLFEATRE